MEFFSFFISFIAGHIPCSQMTPVSRISIHLPVQSAVTLAVYSVNGVLVKTLVKGSFVAGTHGFTWDARDAAGRGVAAGVYVYRLTAGNRVLMEKVVLTR